MKVLIIILLILLMFRKKIKKLVMEKYMLWNPDFKSRYIKYNLKNQRVKNLKKNLDNSKRQLKNYTVVYLPQNNQSVYNRIGGGYLI